MMNQGEEMKKYIAFIAAKTSYIIRSGTEPIIDRDHFDHRMDSALKASDQKPF